MRTTHTPFLTYARLPETTISTCTRSWRRRAISTRSESATSTPTITRRCVIMLPARRARSTSSCSRRRHPSESVKSRTPQASLFCHRSSHREVHPPKNSINNNKLSHLSCLIRTSRHQSCKKAPPRPISRRHRHRTGTLLVARLTVRVACMSPQASTTTITIRRI